MKNILLVVAFCFGCLFSFSQEYNSSDKYWLPQECAFNMQPKELQFAANNSKNITIGEVFDVIFKGKNLTLTKLSLLYQAKITTIEVADEIRNFDILSPVKVGSGSDLRFDISDYLICIDGNIDGKPLGSIIIQACNASGAQDKSMYRNITVLSDLWLGKEKYSTKYFVVAHDFQTREDAVKRYNQIYAPALEKQNELGGNLSDSEYSLLENRNPSLLQKAGAGYMEFDQNRDAIAAFVAGYNRLCNELQKSGYNDVEKKRFSMILASDIAKNYITIGKTDLAYQYLYYAQNMGRELNEYKYALEYVKSLTDIDRASVAASLASEMKGKGLDLTDANTYKALTAIK
ncbi:MAG: hypothetical protein HUK15_05530 [Bacteroidales bacterium]|nr:hypothetical protein [Bacteroidales bacterium]